MNSITKLSSVQSYPFNKTNTPSFKGATTSTVSFIEGVPTVTSPEKLSKAISELSLTRLKRKLIGMLGNRRTENLEKTIKGKLYRTFTNDTNSITLVKRRGADLPETIIRQEDTPDRLERRITVYTPDTINEEDQFEWINDIVNKSSK